MRFLHISDLHLGKTFSASRYGRQFADRRRKELLDTFSKVIDFANDNQVDFILCCGDLLNSEDLRVEELRNINTVIEKLQRAVIVAISGNHDPQTENSAYKKIEWSKHLYLTPPGIGRVALSAYKTIITYHSWDTKEITEPFELPKVSAQPGQYQIMMLHADITSGDSHYLPVDAKQFENSGFDYIALGHIHKAQNVASNAYYSGSLEPLDFGETGEHGFIMVDVEGDRRRWQFVPFASREYKQISFETKPNDSELKIAEDIASSIIRENPHNIYTVSLTGVHPAGSKWDVEKIEDDLRSKEYFCTIEDNTRPEYDLDELFRENQGNLIGDYIGSFQNRQLSEVESKALQYGLELLLSHRQQ